MAPSKKAEPVGELDAICDDFRRAVEALEPGRQLRSLEPWLQQVDPDLRPWLRCELVALYRELNSRPQKRSTLRANEAPEGLDPALWRAIKRSPAFRPLSPKTLEAMAREFRPRDFEAGDSLLRSGETASGLYLILQGDVEVVAVDGTTRSTLDIDGRGSVFGEISTITGEPCTADVMAITPVTAMMLSVERFEMLRDEHPEIEIALSYLVSDRLGQQARDALCGKSLGGYRVERCLSAGAMGVVYVATDPSDGSRRALKMLRHRFIFDPRVVSRFDQEVEFLRSLNHPNIVSLRGHFVAYKTRFMVLDFYDGTDLRRLLRDQGPLQETAARAILGQIADGLRHAHQRGVLHLDLKPANILINQRGHVAITDFGLSKLIAAEAREDEAVGTPLYMPPEQFTMSDVGPHSDWYSLGCIAYEMLTAKRLFPSDGEQDLHALKERQPDQRWPRLVSSDEYRNVVAQAVQPEIANRKMDLDQLATWSRDIPKLKLP